MKKIKYILFFIAAIAVLGSCNKKVEEIPYSNAPVFSINGKIGADSVSFVAGENAEFKTEVQEINGVNFFKGTMIVSGTELSIGWYDGNIAKEKFDPSLLLSKDKFAYSYVNPDPLLDLSLASFSTVQDLQSIHWSVDGVFVSDNNLKLYEQGKYDVCGTFVLTTGDEFEVCNEMIIGFEKNEIFDLKYVIQPDQNLNVWANGVTEQIKSVKWYNNGTLVSTATSLSMTPNSGMNLVTSEIRFKNGSIRKRSILVNNDIPEHSVPDFGTLENSSLLFEDYAVRLSIKSGALEYSTELTENISNYVTITGFDYFGKDETGTPVYRLSGTLNAKVKSQLSPFPMDVKLNFSWGVPLK